MSVNAIGFLNRISKAGYAQPVREVTPAPYTIKNQFVGKTDLNAPEHRDMCNVELLGDEVNGKAIYLLG